MGDWRLLALTSAISLVSSVIVAVVTAMLTSYFTHKNDTKKLIHEKRTELYYTFYDEVDKAISNRKVIFEKDYIMKIVEYKAKVKLISSARVREETENFYNFIQGIYFEYNKFYVIHDPQYDPCADEVDYQAFEHQLEKYKFENVPSIEDLREKTTPLYNAMREDLGSNL